MTVIGLHTTAAQANVKDEAIVTSIVEGVGTLADLGDFEALQDLYAHEVLLDYSSLNGQEATLISSQALMTQWASVLPGFDATKHNVSNIDVQFDRDLANVTANVVADHYVNDLFWQVSGKYRYQLAKQNDQWEIVKHTFILKDEKGTRDVFGQAISKAGESPNRYLVRQQTLAVAKQFLASLKEADYATLKTSLSTDVVLDIPNSGVRIDEASAVIEYLKQFKVSANNDFAEVTYPLKDANMVLAQWQLATDADAAPNIYAGLFHVEQGKITLLRLLNRDTGTQN